MTNLSDEKILHVLNDAAGASRVAESGIPGDTLIWQDALYEGPVTEAEDIDKLAKVRARYFADKGYGLYGEIEKAYLSRNKQLKTYKNYDEIVLWFDHDLFGQLQLAQLVAWFNVQDTGWAAICQIHPEQISKGRLVPRLSHLSQSQALQLFGTRSELTLQQSEICQTAWSAFTSSKPGALTAVFPEDLSTMPFIKNAFFRLIQEYPSKQTGLSRTEFLIIDAVKKKHFDEDSIFAYLQEKEPIAFISKNIFQHRLAGLLGATYPILKKEVIEQETVLEFSDESTEPEENTIVQEYYIKTTQHANQILNRWSDWVQMNGIDRWVGGVHLQEGSIWRYDPVTRKLNKTYA